MSSGGSACVKCAANLKPKATFCTQCGTKVAIVAPAAAAPQTISTTGHECKSCGKELKVGARFCTGCGTTVVIVDTAAPVAAKVEPKPAPVAAAAPPKSDVPPCKSCGKELKLGARFCTGCGSTVVVDAVAKVEPKPAAAPVAAAAVPPPVVTVTAAAAAAPHKSDTPPCKSCGKELKMGARFCTACGTTVVAVAVEAAPKAAPVAAPVKAVAPAVAVVAPAAAPAVKPAKEAVATKPADGAFPCKKCAHELKQGARFCTACGTTVVAASDAAAAAPKVALATSGVPPCVKCGRELKQGARFCTGCGTTVEATVAAAAGPAVSPRRKGPSRAEAEKEAEEARQLLEAKKAAATKARALAEEEAGDRRSSRRSGRTATVSKKAKCVKCAAALKKDSVFCNKCGTPQPKPVEAPKESACHSCKAPLAVNAPFCTKCGTKQTVATAPSGTSVSPQPAAVRCAKAGEQCGSCSAPLKEGMSFCTKCGNRVGAQSGDVEDAKQKEQRERRKQAALEAERALEEERAVMQKAEAAQLALMEQRREASRSVQCGKCAAPMKQGAVFCVRCGANQAATGTATATPATSSSALPKAAKPGDAVVSLLNSFDLPGGDVAALRKADDDYAAEMARIKEESAARLKAKEAELLASLMQFDAQLSETPVEGEDFASQLSDLETKASNAEKDLLEAMRAFEEKQALLNEASPSTDEDDEQPLVTVAAAVKQPAVKLTAKDLDPSKFGLKSFDDLFTDLSDGSDGEGQSGGGGSINSAQDMISRGASLRTQLQEDRKKRADAEAASNVGLDDLDAELAGLSQDAELDLDDRDFEAVGGKFVSRRRNADDSDDSDDDDSD